MSAVTYAGGPFDGKTVSGRYWHLPFVQRAYPDTMFEAPRTVETYERRRGGYVHCYSRPYPQLGDRK